MTEEEKEERRQVAETIVAQLGGRAFKIMTGANSFAHDGKSLSFKLPGNARESINVVKITLTPDDTYDMEFASLRFRKGEPKYRVVSTSEGVYCDNLREIFTETTGLALSVPRVVGVNYPSPVEAVAEEPDFGYTGLFEIDDGRARVVIEID